MSVVEEGLMSFGVAQADVCSHNKYSTQYSMLQ